MLLRVFVLLALDFLRDLLHSNRLSHIHEGVGNVIETFGGSGRGGKIRLFGGGLNRNPSVQYLLLLLSSPVVAHSLRYIYAAEQALPDVLRLDTSGSRRQSCSRAWSSELYAPLALTVACLLGCASAMSVDFAPRHMGSTDCWILCSRGVGAN